MIDLSEIVLATRAEAEAVLDELYKLVENYEFVSVGDYLELVGIGSTFTDQKMGWIELKDIQIKRITSAGFVLDLPKPTLFKTYLQSNEKNEKDVPGLSVEQHASLRDAIRYDVNERGMSHADVAQKHDITIRSVNAALENDEIVMHNIILTQLGTGTMGTIKVLVPRGTTYEQVAENWRSF